MIHLHYLQDGAVALVTLERPPANAFTPEGLLHHLQQTIERLNH
ncbi:enoyl-CoA hydratase/carnithine racemase [Caballeronia udeis]|uniref:Enoyl-CoA hydratase/carnithine racemase n=1 Tax=Caballeronia udeis TaxID=1232866 RepID=A0ABW8MY57_9BURK